MLIFFYLFTEIEAAEACKWLRAAGFPQYAQMFEGKFVVCLFVCLSVECIKSFNDFFFKKNRVFLFFFLGSMIFFGRWNLRPPFIFFFYFFFPPPPARFLSVSAVEYKRTCRERIKSLREIKKKKFSHRKYETWPRMKKKKCRTAKFSLWNYIHVWNFCRCCCRCGCCCCL